MQEYFVEQPLREGDVIELPKDKAHHAFDVLHLDHETIRLVSGGIGYFADAYQEGRTGFARVLKQDPAVNELQTSLTLCMALIRREKFELVLQKAAELGVSRIVPFVSSRCVAKDREEKAEKVAARRRAILLGAAEQCKRNKVPELMPTCSLQSLGTYRSKLNLAAYEKAGEQASRLSDLLPAESVSVVIGPEGGFSEAEIDVLNRDGFLPVSLGNRILRAETAAYYVCSVIGELCR